LTIFVSVSVD